VSSTPAISVVDVHKSFGPLAVLKGVSFDVPRGAVVSRLRELQRVVPHVHELRVVEDDAVLQYGRPSLAVRRGRHLHALLEIHERRTPGEIAGFYMLQGGAPCVIDAYMGYLERFIVEQRLDDLFLLIPGADNDQCGYDQTTLAKYTLPALLVALWHFAVELRWVAEGIIPSPAQVLRSWHTWIFGSTSAMLSPYSGTWLDNVAYSSRRVLQGFGLAALVAIPLGLLIGWSRLANRVVDPTIQLLRPVPITAWLPFAIAVFGIYDASALFLIGLGAFYPIVVNTTHGVRDTNLLLMRAARMLGAGSGTVLAKVVFPSALPSIFTGLRLGIGIAWTAVIVAEMIAVKSGLGYVLWDAYYVGRMDICVATMFSVGLLGFISDRLIVWAARLLLRWRTLEAHA